MRHTRNKQLEKLGIDCKDLNNVKMDDKRNPKLFWFDWHHQDHTFKWHREYGREFMPWGQNYISFGNVVRLVKF
ncbi:hypothetical protein [Bacillus cereus]